MALTPGTTAATRIRQLKRPPRGSLRISGRTPSGHNITTTQQGGVRRKTNTFTPSGSARATTFDVESAGTQIDRPAATARGRFETVDAAALTGTGRETFERATGGGQEVTKGVVIPDRGIAAFASRPAGSGAAPAAAVPPVTAAPPAVAAPTGQPPVPTARARFASLNSVAPVAPVAAAPAAPVAATAAREALGPTSRAPRTAAERLKFRSQLTGLTGSTSGRQRIVASALAREQQELDRSRGRNLTLSRAELAAQATAGAAAAKEAGQTARTRLTTSAGRDIADTQGATARDVAETGAGAVVKAAGAKAGAAQVAATTKAGTEAKKLDASERRTLTNRLNTLQGLSTFELTKTQKAEIDANIAEVRGQLGQSERPAAPTVVAKKPTALSRFAKSAGRQIKKAAGGIFLGSGAGGRGRRAVPGGNVQQFASEAEAEAANLPIGAIVQTPSGRFRVAR